MTFIIADSIFREHITPPGHPERSKRYDSVIEALNGYVFFPARDATEEDLLTCHTPEYLKIVKRDIAAGLGTLSTGDVEICAKSYDVAIRAAGAVLNAVDLVIGGTAKRVFCAVRPPGHHACRDKGMGFCIFNNIAIGARYAQKKYQVSRVLIVDWDVHHGNGTQEIFNEDPTVYYFSTHEFPLYPGTGSSEETGFGKGAMSKLNVPIAPGKQAREKVLQAFQVLLRQKMADFRPQLVMISAGFDAHEDDPLGHLGLKTEDFAALTKAVKQIADEYADGKIISVLEGGYNLGALAASVKAHVSELSRD